MKVVIFANGQSEYLRQDRKLVSADDFIICANGGTLYALELKLTPNLIIGDLDSLPTIIANDLAAKGVEFRKHPVLKDRTDLDLALEAAMEKNPDEILVLTALGKRLDQLLSNIFLLTRKQWQKARISLADGPQRAWIMHGPDRLVLSGTPGDMLSILPLTAKLEGVSLTGVFWPLENAEVRFGESLTISNQLTGNRAEIFVQAGIGLVVQIVKYSSSIL